jgi:biotin-dependent carboxylase-like uncharacterized protein
MSIVLCEVVKAGLLTTIQDLGRPGFRKFGVPVSGAMDSASAILANELVGNPAHYSVLEITQTGPALIFKTYGALAITGADLTPTLNGIPIANNETIFFAKGDHLAFGPLKRGVLTYLAFAGELQAEKLFGSVSTHQGNQWGGLNGKPLMTGDRLKLNPAEHKVRHQKIESAINNTRIIRLAPSLEFDKLSTSDQERLFTQQWTLSASSNRTGIRLEGEPLESKLPEMISSPTDRGILQLPPSGLPLVLMNDSAAIGGYPRIGAVLQEDIPILVQKPPGSALQFKMVNY